ncbi:NUDIX hydrolase [Paracoccus jiaweipingae]|uniref:NUDIX hydrolase n=1 Tax=unclassified Paracoccus (in: a-proteobacteria) TaxID=2688777 RepID=UPI0037AB5058
MKPGFRDRLGRLIGRPPAAMQVAALCLNPARDRVLLITSRGTGRWVIPKGWPMPGLSMAQAAAQEAWEEAGIRGRVGPDPIGHYSYAKTQDRGFAIPIEVAVYVLDTDEAAQDFPERDQRRRQWFYPVEAAGLVAEDGLRQILLRLTQQ